MNLLKKIFRKPAEVCTTGESDKKLKNIVTGIIAQTDNVTVNQVDESKVKRMLTAMKDEDKEGMLKHIDEFGEEATILQYRKELESLLAMEILRQALPLALGIPVGEMNENRLRQIVDEFSESDRQSYLELARKAGIDRAALYLAETMKKSFKA